MQSIQWFSEKPYVSYYFEVLDQIDIIVYKIVTPSYLYYLSQIRMYLEF
jgi:hypothetical protein